MAVLMAAQLVEKLVFYLAAMKAVLTVLSKVVMMDG